MASRTLTAVDRASKTGDNLEEDLRILDKKLGQLRLDYEQYFLGARPREPHLLRQEIQKQVNILAQTPMLNTALRFRFNSICSRFMAFRRQWDAILRQIADDQLARFRRDKSAAEKLLSVGESPRNEALDVSELAAWTTIASVILNLDETLTRG